MAGENDNVDRGDDFTPTLDALDTTNVDQNVDQGVDQSAAKTDDVKVDDTKTDDKTESVRDDKGRFIPKSRFDEAVQKERDRAETLARQNAELQKQLQTVDRSAKVEDLEKQIKELRIADRKAIMDGDEEKSIELASQIDRLNRQIVIAESQTMSTQAAEEARESIRVETAIEKLESMYDVLKEGSETFDQGLVDLVLAQQQSLMARERMSPSQALTKAATDIMARFQPAAAVDEKPAGGLKDAKGADRTTAAKQKNIDAALKTPPDVRDIGLDTDKAGMKDGLPTPANIDDLKQIPESVLKRMRGDMA